MEICRSHHLEDAEEFVEKWMAYSISNLGGAEPTLEYLVEMENREFNKINSNQSKNLKRTSENVSNLRVYKQNADDEVDEEESALLGSYVCITPKVSEIYFINLPGAFICLMNKMIDLRV